jgi:hypothetical protein
LHDGARWWAPRSAPLPTLLISPSAYALIRHRCFESPERDCFRALHDAN